MSDYELHLKIKNAPLLRLMRENGFKTAADLSRKAGASQSYIGHMLGLTTTVYDAWGHVRGPVQKVADALLVHPEEMFPEKHWHQPLEKNTFVAELSAEQAARLSNNSAAMDPCTLLEHMQTEDRDAFADMCEAGRLTGREKDLMRKRFVEGKTLKQTGMELESPVTSERLRQMEFRALRKMQNPHRRKGIVEAAGIYAGDRE